MTPPTPSYFDIVRNVAKRLGIRFRAGDGLWRAGAQLVYPGGKVRYMYRSGFGLNTEGAREMARIKPLSLTFLQKAGISVPEFDYFFADQWAARNGLARNQAAALAFADRLGYPLVLKPSSKARGTGVHLVGSREHLAEVLPNVARLDRMYLVQRYVSGTEFRVVVLDGKCRLAWTKAPIRVVGDGQRTLDALIDAHLAGMVARGFKVSRAHADPGIDSVLVARGLSRSTVPAAGTALQVGVAAGYDTGGTLGEGLDILPGHVADACVEIARLAGLRLAGLDIVVPAVGTPDLAPYYLLEINPGPAFQGYLSTGPEAPARVEALVESILVAMGENLP